MRLITLICGVFFCLACNGQKIFPLISGITLDDKQVSVPYSNGKYSVVGIAFSRKAEEDLKKWVEPLYDSFVKKEETAGQFDFADLMDVNFLFIPLVSGFKKIVGNFKKRSDEHYWPYILNPEKSPVNEIRRKLEVQDKEHPYFYVLDQSGTIIEMVTGQYSQAKLEKLENAVK
jgi:hypothetical protein